MEVKKKTRNLVVHFTYLSFIECSLLFDNSFYHLLRNTKQFLDAQKSEYKRYLPSWPMPTLKNSPINKFVVYVNDDFLLISTFKVQGDV